MVKRLFAALLKAHAGSCARSCPVTPNRAELQVNQDTCLHLAEAAFILVSLHPGGICGDFIPNKTSHLTTAKSFGVILYDCLYLPTQFGLMRHFPVSLCSGKTNVLSREDWWQLLVSTILTLCDVQRYEEAELLVDSAMEFYSFYDNKPKRKELEFFGLSATILGRNHYKAYNYIRWVHVYAWFIFFLCFPLKLNSIFPLEQVDADGKRGSASALECFQPGLTRTATIRV